MTVDELIPGDRITNAGTTAIFVARTDHPIWPYLRLVVWRLSTGDWSLDALSGHQDVGALVDGNRDHNLRSALLGNGA